MLDLLVLSSLRLSASAVVSYLLVWIFEDDSFYHSMALEQQTQIIKRLRQKRNIKKDFPSHGSPFNIIFSPLCIFVFQDQNRHMLGAF